MLADNITVTELGVSFDFWRQGSGKNVEWVLEGGLVTVKETMDGVWVYLVLDRDQHSQGYDSFQEAAQAGIAALDFEFIH